MKLPKLPFLRKKTDDQLASAVEQEKVTTAEGVRDEVGVATNRTLEEIFADKIKERARILDEAKSEISNITNYEEAKKLEEKTIRSLPDDQALPSKKDEHEFLTLLDDKLEEIYGIRIFAHDKFNKAFELGHEIPNHQLELMGFRRDGQIRYWISPERGAKSVTLSFEGGKTMVFNSEKDVIFIDTALLGLAKKITVDLEISPNLPGLPQ